MAILARKGRGAGLNPAGRFEAQALEPVDDGWGSLEAIAQAPAPRTELLIDTARRVITRNDSPDIGFDRSINPYRGCEHGCIYCYARPSHSYMGLSSGIDFETKIFAKPDAAARLEAELGARGYVPQPIALGTNTDPYQPLERRERITRAILEVLVRCRHPFTITTKSAGVVRDLDLLAEAAASKLTAVQVSVTSLDPGLSRRLEPRCSAPAKRLGAIGALAAAGVPVGVNVSPVIPALNDHEIERILKAAAEAGARFASTIFLRLPHDVKDLFIDWLERHEPNRKARVLGLVREARGGRLNDPDFGTRMRGAGAYAHSLRTRFEQAARRFGLARPDPFERLRTDLFEPPGPTHNDRQLQLF